MRRDFVPAQRTNTRVEKCARQRGFSILEMLIASVILMVGIIGVVQLVPASLQLNASNRYDTLSTVIAQRELDQMLAQPVDTITFTDSSGNLVSLGGAGSPGAPVVMQGPMAQIDFTADPVAGFSIASYMDPNDPNFPNGATFELRWAVIPQVSGGRVISKRIILGCRQTNATQPILPVNLDSWKFRGD
jgi:prepilin-type N-terminal cleavage/methylation domain-containing protein